MMHSACTLYTNLLREQWKVTTLVRERILIHNVPVEHVNLVVSHGVLNTRKHIILMIELMIVCSLKILT